MGPIRMHYLDASALVKLFVVENGSSVLRDYVSEHSVFSTTSICFAEALGVLKSKFLRKLLLQEDYLAACEELTACIRNGEIKIEDIGISDRSVFDQVEDIAREYTLDISDAFQIVTLKIGIFSLLKIDYKPIMITADKALAKAAINEGLMVWDCLSEPSP